MNLYNSYKSWQNITKQLREIKTAADSLFSIDKAFNKKDMCDIATLINALEHVIDFSDARRAERLKLYKEFQK